MVQARIFAGIAITAGWNRNPREVSERRLVRVDPKRMLIEVLR